MNFRNKFFLGFALLTIAGIANAMFVEEESLITRSVNNGIERYSLPGLEQYYAEYNPTTGQYSGNIPFTPGLGDIENPANYTQDYLKYWFNKFKEHYSPTKG